MNRFFSRMRLTALLAGLAVPASVAAEHPHPPDPNCPPDYHQDYWKNYQMPVGPEACPSPFPAPYGVPGVPAPVMPGVPGMPGVPPSSDPTVPDPGVTPQPAPAPAPTPAPSPADTGTASLFGSGQTSTAGSGGGSVLMAGRADSANRFNLFDNMSAIPQSRMWFSYLYTDNYSTFLQQPGVRDPIFQEQHSNLYRVGVEWALTRNFSIAAQGQYVSYGEDLEAWANPQIMTKYAVINNCDTVLSTTFGVQIEADSSNSLIRETTTRFAPGLLLYRALGDNLFYQGGMQFNFVDDNLPTTYDHAFTFGYWLYRAPDLDVSGRQAVDYCGCVDSGRGSAGGRLLGIIPQLGIYGKHLLVGGNREGNLPYSFPSGEFSSATLGTTPVQYFEDRNVYDVTSSIRFLFRRMSFNAGVSVPITGPDVRDIELLGGVNFNF